MSFANPDDELFAIGFTAALLLVGEGSDRMPRMDAGLFLDHEKIIIKSRMVCAKIFVGKE